MLIGALVALSLATAAAPGSELKVAWTTKLPGHAMRACVVDGGTVYQGVTQVVRKKERGTLVALDAVTGKIRWQSDVGPSGVHAAPLVVGDVVIHGAFGGEARALDKATGAERWRAQTSGGGLLSTPVLDGSAVWLGFIGGAVKLDAASGTELLRMPREAGTHVLGTHPGRVYLHDAVANLVLGFDSHTGAELWRLGGPNIDREKDLHAGFQPEQAALDAQLLYVPTNVAETWAVDVVTGKKRWGYEPGPSGSFGTVLGLSGTAVFLTSSDQKSSVVVRVDAKTGVESWRQPVAGIVHAVPLLMPHPAGGEVVLVPSGSGKVHAFGARDGEPRGSVTVGAAYWAGCAGEGLFFVGHDRKKISAIHVR